MFPRKFFVIISTHFVLWHLLPESRFNMLRYVSDVGKEMSFDGKRTGQYRRVSSSLYRRFANACPGYDRELSDCPVATVSARLSSSSWSLRSRSIVPPAPFCSRSVMVSSALR